MSILEQGNGGGLTEHNNDAITHGLDTTGNTLQNATEKNAIHISFGDV